jgi:hypothetical protein
MQSLHFTVQGIHTLVLTFTWRMRYVGWLWAVHLGGRHHAVSAAGQGRQPGYSHAATRMAYWVSTMVMFLPPMRMWIMPR